MGKVLKADATFSDATVQCDVGGVPEVWVTAALRFESSTLSDWVSAGASPYFVLLLDAVSTFIDYLFVDSGPDWVDAFPGGTGTPPTPTADEWHLVEVHYTNGDAVDFFVDGDGLSTTDTGTFLNTRFVDVGLTASVPPAGVAYFDDVKIGTTRGGDDLFSDDFEDGTLDAWTTTSGDVSVIDDPFAASVFTFPGVCDVAFTDPTLEAFPTWTAL